MIKQPTILDTIKQTSSQIEDLKSKQYVNADSFKNYSIQSSNSYDYSVYIPNRYATTRLVFVPDDTSNYIITDPNVIFSIDNQNVAGNISVSTGHFYMSIICEAPQKTRYSWIINFKNHDYNTSVYQNIPHTFYVKVFFTSLSFFSKNKL